MGDEGPRPGLLILDMSNDQIKGVAYNKAAVIANAAQLALSDFFHVCIDSKAEVPGFRAKQKGAKLVDELVGMEHINHFPKSEDSALSNPKVLESLKSLKISHVCVCGISTDSSVIATAKDLVDNGFEIFVVKDATTSKNGKFGHDKGLRDIQSKFGDGVVVGIDDLLGEEEIVEETVTESASEWVEEVVDDSYSQATEMTAEEKAEKARLADAERLAARKKQVDEKRFAHIKEANAKAKAMADPKRAAEIEKDTTEADKYASNLPQNKGAQAAPAAPAPAPAPEQKSAAPAKKEKKGMFGGLFGKKKAEPAPAPAPAPKAAPAPAPKPAPSPAPESASAPKKVATTMPGGGAGQKTWIKPKPEGQKKTTYTPDGAVAQPLGVKKMVQGNAVQERIRGLQDSGIRTVPTGPRKMKTPKIVTDTKETWDKQGNITREITRYITEIDGTKRTEKEVVKIPAKK